MDPLSGAASVIAVLQLSSEVVRYINSAKGATQVRRSFREELRACESILQQLTDEADDSEEGQAWSDTVRALEAPGAPVGRLWAALSKIKDRLQPKEGVKKAFAVLTWPFNEREIKEVFETIAREKSLLQLALANNSRKLLQEIQRTSKENEQQLVKLIQAMRVTSAKSEAQLTDGFATIQRSQAGLHDGLDSLQRRYDKQERLEVRSVILSWLAQEDYAADQRNYLNRRQEGTGQWLLESPEFQDWLEYKIETLFCPGIPGAGKTILTSTVIDKLFSRFRDDDSVGVAYVYCNFQRQNEQDPRSLLASILRQLSQGRSALPDCVELLYDRHERHQTLPNYEEVSTALHSTVCLYSRVFVVIDALDECQLAENYRSKLLSTILKLQAECGISLFVTSRHIPVIVDTFHQSTTLEISASEQDVRQFLEGNISRLPSFVQRSAQLQDLVKSAIVKAVDGMFLLATFHLESLCGKRSVKALRKTLESLPTGSEAYDCVYDGAMKRIESQVRDQAELAKLVLSWITRASRQLKATELQHALAVEAGETFLDPENLPQLDDMVSSCAGLVTMDEETNVIRLIHYTAQEYFNRTWEQWFPHAEAEITKTCCIYLLFETFASGPCKSGKAYEERLEENPVFEYAAENWGLHASKPGISHQEVINFLKSIPNVEATSQVLFIRRNPTHFRPDYARFPARFRGLHLAAYFDLEYAANILLNDEVFRGCVDLKDGYGFTPLAWAARNGNKAVVSLLLADERVDPSLKDNRGLTPLGWAANNGCKSVAELLLASGKVDPNSEERSGGTPLALAAEEGHKDIVELLLESGIIDPDSTGEAGLTPLARAAANGHIAVIETLLATKRVKVNSKTVNPKKNYAFGDIPSSRTPLSFAAEAGHEGVVKLLMEASLADIDLKDGLGITPLSYAARSGHQNVTELLLATEGVDADSKCTEPPVRGRTPLSFAAERGFVSIVEQLLRTGKVDVNSKTWGSYVPSRTPLSFAAESGHVAIVKLLLDTGHVDADSMSTGKYAPGRERSACVDSDSEVTAGESLPMTPLLCAAEAGKENVVQLLLKEGANVNSTDSLGQTPLLQASMHGNAAVVELLLTVPGVKADQEVLSYNGNREESLPDPNTDGHFTKGLTSLSLPAERGHAASVTTLYSRGLDVNHQNQRGRTALLLASMYGRRDVICQLIAAGAEVDLGDEDNRTPLSYSAERGHIAIVEFLLGQGAGVGSEDTHGRTPLSHACSRRSRFYWRPGKVGYGDVQAVVKLLLKNGAEVNSKDKNGRTPLSHSVGGGPGSDTIVKLLLETGAEVNSEDKIGRTPLSHGVDSMFSSDAIVSLLLENGAVIDSEDESGRTPLSYSAGGGSHSDTIIQLLLENGAEVNSEDRNGRTPLLHAVTVRRSEAVIGSLLANHADVYCKDTEGRTALSVATAHKNDSIVKLLLEAGADSRPDVKRKSG